MRIFYTIFLIFLAIFILGSNATLNVDSDGILSHISGRRFFKDWANKLLDRKKK